jgi:hypothetical protein
MDISEMVGGSIVKDLVSVAWMAIPLGLLAAWLRSRRKGERVQSLDLEVEGRAAFRAVRLFLLAR